MPPTKRSPSSTAKSPPAAKKAKSALALEEWRVVLTGNFVVKPKSVLEQTLKSKAVAVTGSISGKTTHLILGESGVNEYGQKTGVGSSKYNQAAAKGLEIVSEKEVWAILTGTVSASELTDKKKAAKINANKSSSLVDKIVFCIQEVGGGKVSLPKLKTELTTRFDLKWDAARSKNSLKTALGKLVDQKKLVKEGASYKLPDVVEGPAVQAWTQEDKQADVNAKIKKLCPPTGRWRGLGVVATKKATGKATCKACGGKIEKGQDQVQVMDDSLFRMVVWPEDCHEGVTRGYVECGYPGHEVISRAKFFIHSQCQSTAEEQCEEKFHQDWSEVRPFEIDTRGGAH